MEAAGDENVAGRKRLQQAAYFGYWADLAGGDAPRIYQDSPSSAKLSRAGNCPTVRDFV